MTRPVPGSGTHTAARTTSRVWFITGCSRGLGREIARAALSQGDCVAATARRPASLNDLRADGHGRLAALACDVTDAASVALAVQQTVERFGTIDVVVNNAGYGVAGAVEEVTEQQATGLFDANVLGVLRVLRATLPVLRAQRSGHVINVSSVAGWTSSPGLGLYAATKHAVEALTDALADELAAIGIAVTALEPGGFRTDWAGQSMQQAARIADYDTSSGRVRAGLAASDGRQPGDPARLAAAVLGLVDEPTPPHRLALGSDAVVGIRRALDDAAAELTRLEPRSRTTDFTPSEV